MVTIANANAKITGKGVRITKADLNIVTGIKADDAIIGWAALVALVRLEDAKPDNRVEVRTANGAGTLSDEFVLNYAELGVRHLILDVRSIISSDNVEALPTSLGNTFRKPVRDAHAGRPVRTTPAKRFGIAGRLSWARTNTDSSEFVFVAHDNMAHYL
jgi:hypothetical protein